MNEQTMTFIQKAEVLCMVLHFLLVWGWGDHFGECAFLLIPLIIPTHAIYSMMSRCRECSMLGAPSLHCAMGSTSSYGPLMCIQAQFLA
ncbi:hypothetical protein GDO81_003487 [Engystomops pustulosus]|uniref:Uncharacterized protein n=1 Tax=Engystomops pustulosus TaxID=76066 RepID=A0AAV6ZX84_ENGPU|nr:hypothetical protein GDO81_003487 [Engystomops pustulosus]